MSLAVDVVDRLEAYVRLLAKWNASINLTSLPLALPTGEAIDRLLIEPLVAASHVGTPRHWYDLGSGGGSPAIPFKLVHPHARLTMVESKSRKAAFLREAVRELGLTDTDVECSRFEQLAIDKRHIRVADLVTVRAVKGDQPLFATLERLLCASGKALLFHARGTTLSISPAFETVRTVELGTLSGARLTIAKPCST